MIPLAVWLVQLGYLVAWVGYMNWGIRYEAQSDGSIAALDKDGKATKAWTLGDAIACSGQPSRQLAGQAPMASGPQVQRQGQASSGVPTDCTPRPGDLRVGPFIWRPQNPLPARTPPPVIGGVVSYANGALIGPCP